MELSSGPRSLSCALAGRTARGARVSGREVSSHVLIIGGGASGVLLAAHLLRRRDLRFRVTLVEKRATLGRGVAYATAEPSHLLNTRALSMSAFVEDPEHFLRWLGPARGDVAADPLRFVRREVYGRYLSDLVSPWRAPGGDGRLHTLWGEVVALSSGRRGVLARLADGQTVSADFAALATGHEGLAQDGPLSDPWRSPGVVGPDASVLLLGAGLTMVDQVLSLLDSGHRGPIRALSRRGLLPQTHARTPPVRLELGKAPPAAALVPLSRWLRGVAREAEAAGGDWRDVVDAMRGQAQGLWIAMPEATRRRFLRHARPWWDTHRHRMPPESADRLREAISAGRLRIERGRFLEARAHHDDSARGPITALWRRWGGRGVEALVVDRILDCRGLLRDPETLASRLTRALLDSGQARVDALRLGLDVAPDGALRSADGAASALIFAIGPAAKAAFWESTAIPEIRAQARALSDRLAGLALTMAARAAPRRQSQTAHITAQAAVAATSVTGQPARRKSAKR